MSVLLADSQEALALGSATLLTLVSADADANRQLFKQLWQIIFKFERQFSRFLPTSELSTFNRQAGTWQPVSAEFEQLLKAAKNIGEETGGLYNPFVLPALQRAGYTKSFAPGFENDQHDDYSTKAVVPVSRLELRPGQAFIPYGTALDLGGCGKGYLADYLVDTAIPDWVEGYCFSLGGDIIAGGVDQSGQPWRPLVEPSQSGTDAIWEVKTKAKRFAVATSGTAVRQGVHNGKKWHHIIDPRTQAPAKTDIQLATIYDASALRADVYASCAIIVGAEQAPAFFKQYGIKAALIQGQTAAGKSFQTSFGRLIVQAKAEQNLKVGTYA